MARQNLERIFKLNWWKLNHLISKNEFKTKNNINLNKNVSEMRI